MRPEEGEEDHQLGRDDPALLRGIPRRLKKVLPRGEVGKATTRAAAGNRPRIETRRREEGRLDPDRGDLLLVEDRRTSSILEVQRVQVSQAIREVLLPLLRRRVSPSRSDCSTTRAAGLRSGQAGVLFLLLLRRRAVGVRKAASVLRTRKERREELRYYRTESEGEDRAGEAAAAGGGGGTAARFRTLLPPQKKTTTSRTSCACKAERRASLNRVLLLPLQPSLGCRVLRREVLLLLRTGTWRLLLLLAGRRRRSRRRTGQRWQRRPE